MKKLTKSELVTNLLNRQQKGTGVISKAKKVEAVKKEVNAVLEPSNILNLTNDEIISYFMGLKNNKEFLAQFSDINIDIVVEVAEKMHEIYDNASVNGLKSDDKKKFYTRLEWATKYANKLLEELEEVEEVEPVRVALSKKPTKKATKKATKEVQEVESVDTTPIPANNANLVEIDYSKAIAKFNEGNTVLVVIESLYSKEFPVNEVFKLVYSDDKVTVFIDAFEFAGLPNNVVKEFEKDIQSLITRTRNVNRGNIVYNDGKNDISYYIEKCYIVK